MTTQLSPSIPFGVPIPPNTPHVMSVSLPTWRDTVAFKTEQKGAMKAVLNGYPRMFIQLNLRKLASMMEGKYGTIGEKCMIFPTFRIAKQCESFIHARQAGARAISLVICPGSIPNTRVIDSDCKNPESNHLLEPDSFSPTKIHVVLFPEDAFSIASEFWKNTGQGISSRLADHYLSMLAEDSVDTNCLDGRPPLSQPALNSSTVNVGSTELEKRCGGPFTDDAVAKRAMQQRIANLLIRRNAGEQHQVCSGYTRVMDVTENDVYLFPTGAAAVWNGHQLALAVRPPGKSVCFGFTFPDTLNSLQKWGPGCHTFSRGDEGEIDELEALLEQESARDPTKPPILALFTEFTTNPLLCSPNLPRLRDLADKYAFLILVDDTIGTFCNVDVLLYADVLLTSLSKYFSGFADVMGGSLVLNPNGRHYAVLKAHMDVSYRDIYFRDDVIHMEWNSRGFERRMDLINRNAEVLCDFLHSHSVAGGAANAVIKQVFFPKYTTPENYEHCRIKVNSSSSSESGNKGGGYGGLFSLTFTSDAASHAFYDHLACFKGPSFGTYFTLMCAYAVLAHYNHLEWSEQYGVEEGLVRVGVGIEDREAILDTFQAALRAAEDAHQGGVECTKQFS